MIPARVCLVVLMTLVSVLSLLAQEAPLPRLSPSSAHHPVPDPSVPNRIPQVQTVDLVVPPGTPLQVALADELRVDKPGEPVHGRIVEPVYAFDRVVIPAGANVYGQVTNIEKIPRGRRALDALNADLTPARKVVVDFYEIELPDGRRLHVETRMAEDSGQLLQFVTTPNPGGKKNRLKDAASEKTRQAKQQARQQWDTAIKQLNTPGRLHRLARYGEGQLPVHRQFVSPGTMYMAELLQPLSFGSEVITPAIASTLGAPLPEGSVVHARLLTPLSSATAHKGQPVEAVVSQPLMDGNRLILSQGARLKGTVRQAEPAHMMKKNGQLRLAFSELVPPDGLEQKVVTTLEGVQAGRDANVKLDSEGGAEATTSKSRYLATAISVGLAAASMHGDEDRGRSAAGDTNGRAAGGLGGFKLVGMVAGTLVRSRAFGYTMGAYGAGMSVYSHFIARGREVVFPKNTAMQIGIGTRASKPAEAVPHAALVSANELENLASGR